MKTLALLITILIVTACGKQQDQTTHQVEADAYLKSMARYAADKDDATSTDAIDYQLACAAIVESRKAAEEAGFDSGEIRAAEMRGEAKAKEEQQRLSPKRIQRNAEKGAGQKAQLR